MAASDLNRTEWCRAVASASGPSSAVVRHVLLTLALRMNSDAANAFPSQKTLATECGLSRRTIIRALESAELEGWLIRKLGRRDGGRNWRLTEYAGSVPPSAYCAIPERPWERRDRESPPDQLKGANGAEKDEGGDFQGAELVTFTTEGGDSGATVTYPVTKKREERRLPATVRSNSEKPTKTADEILREVAGEPIFKIRCALPALTRNLSDEEITALCKRTIHSRQEKHCERHD